MDAMFPAEIDQVFITPGKGHAGFFKIVCFWCRKYLNCTIGLSSAGVVEAFSHNFVIFFCSALQTEVDHARELTCLMRIACILQCCAKLWVWTEGWLCFASALEPEQLNFISLWAIKYAANKCSIAWASSAVGTRRKVRLSYTGKGGCLKKKSSHQLHLVVFSFAPFGWHQGPISRGTSMCSSASEEATPQLLLLSLFRLGILFCLC